MKTEQSTETISTMEAVAWMRKIRLQCEASGRDPMQCEEYLEARAVSAGCAARAIDGWKERLAAPMAAAERDLDEPANLHEASARVRQLLDVFKATGNPADKAAWKRAEKQFDQLILAALDGQEAEGYAQAERDEGRHE
jgi:hypothetical protein